MERKLLIVSSFINIEKLRGYYNDSCDVLALTPSAFVSLDSVQIPYRTTGDFYNDEMFRNDLNNLHEKIEVLLNKLDKIYEGFVSFPYSYSGNFVYFTRLLTNLFYLEKIAQKIRQNYNKIFLFSDAEPQTFCWDNLTYSDLLSMPQTKGLENKIQVLRTILPVEIVSGVSQYVPPVSYTLKMEAFLKGIIPRIRKGVKEKRLPIIKNVDIFDGLDSNRKILFVIQDGYEVGFLRKHLREFKFINPVNSLRRKIPTLPCGNYDFNPVKNELNDFLEADFSKTKSLIESLFLSYHREFVGKLDSFKKSFKELVEQNSPKALLFSVGARDVFDRVICYIANEKDIPVLYFQHGGAVLFIKNSFLKHSERDVNVKKTLILNSVVESEKAKHNGSECFAFGSIMRYQLLKETENNLNNTGKIAIKALYCCSPFVYYNYTSLLWNISDKCKYQVNRDVLEASQQELLGLDVKLHPIEEDSCFHYFRKSIEQIKHLNSKVIYRQLAESILRSYGLVIFDSIGSAVFPFVLSLKVPIILYLKDLSLLHSYVMEDLKKRCYFANDKKELSILFRRYVALDMPTKWSLDIVDRYVYPVKNGHPGENIANYVRSVCSV